MNKIYRLVWNRETGTMVVASELAKSDGGRTVGGVLASPRLVISALASALLLAVGGHAMAADGQKHPISGGSGDNYCYYDSASHSVICGDGSTSVADTYDGKQAKSVAIGVSATTTGESNVALGANSSASHTSGLAIGAKTKAHNNQTIAIGENATSMGEVDIMIGKSAGLNNTATSSTGRNIGIGEGAVSSAVNANNVIGIGTGAAAEINGSHIVAIGTDANKGIKTQSSVAVGYKATSPGTSSVAVGNAANSTGTTSIAVGNAASASDTNAVAVGKMAQAGASSVAVGSNTVATQAATVAVGSGAKTGNQRAIAIGENAHGAGTHTVAMGRAATSSGVSAIAIGGTQNEATNTQATGNYSIAVGAQETIASGASAIAFGNQTKATHDKAIALGKQTEARAIGAVAIGGWGSPAELLGNRATISKAPYSVVLGTAAQANEFSDSAVVIGNQAEARGASINSTAKDSVAIGYRSLVTTASNIAIGSSAKADGNSQATAIGNNANAQGYQSIAFGSNSVAGVNAGASVVIGVEANAQTSKSVAIGHKATIAPTGIQNQNGTGSRGSFSTVVIGDEATVAGEGSVAIGKKSKTTYINSTAVGNEAQAVGYNTTAVGFEAKAFGISSVAIGDKAEAGTADPTTGAPLFSQSVAVGTASKATALNAVALGSNAEVAAPAHRGTALGVKSQVTVGMGVALGGFSIADRGHGVVGADPLGAKEAGSAENVWTSTASAVSVGGGLNPVNSNKTITRQIINVAAGSQDTDAVNVAQLKAAGFKLTTSKSGSGEVQGDTLEKVQNGETLTIDAGDNIKLIQAANKITVAVNAQKTVEDAHSPVVYTNANGDRLYKHTDGKFYTTKDGTGNPVDPPDVIASMQNAIGQTNYPMTLANVAPGALNDKSTQAVNGSQLFATNQNVATNAENIAKGIHVGGTTGSNQYALGDTINIKGDSNISSSTVAGGVQLALAPVLNVGPAAGGKPVKIDGNAGTVGGLSNTTFDPNDVTSGQAATEDQLKAVNDKAVAAKTKVDAGDNIEVASTTNADGSTTYTVATKKEVAFDKVTAGTGSNQVVLDNTGVKVGANTLTGDAISVNGTRVTNVNTAINQVAAQAYNPLTFSGDTGTDVSRKLGETVKVTGGRDDEADLSELNIGVVANGSDTLEIKLAKDLIGLSSAQFQDADGNITTVDGDGISIEPADPAKGVVSLTSAGLDNGGNQITNVASGGDVDTNAANIGDVKAAAAKATTKVDAGDNIEVASTTNADGSTTYTVATKKDVTFDSVTAGGNTLDANGLAIAGGPIISVSGIDMAGKKISNLADGTEDGDAVNFSQLKAVQTLVNAGWTVTDASGNAAKIGPNGVVTFSSADSNISVAQTGADQAGKVEITLNRNLDLDSVTAGGNKLDANGLAIAGGPTISATGIDMGGKKISNLGDGTEEGDAVNLGQLKSYVGEETAKVKTHYYSVNDGGTKGGNYDNDGATGNGAIAAGVDTTATAENAVAMGKGAAASHAGSVALGAGAQTQAVDNTGTFMLNGGTAAGVNAVAVVSVGSKGNERRIVNVAAGRLSADSTDAVNGSQLFAVGTAVNNLGNATALALGGNTTYTPGAGLSVNLTVGGNTYTNVQDALNAVSGGGTGATKVVAGTNTQVTQNGDTYTVSVVDNPVVDGKATFNGGIEVAGGQSVNMGGNVVRNVAAGVADTDAVNVGQLNGAIAGANAYTDGRFNQLANDMWQIDRGYRGATASAMAMAGLPQAYLPGKSMFSAAVGGYRGEYGLAFGLSGITDNGKWVYKAQASGNTARDWGFSAGVGVQW